MMDGTGVPINGKEVATCTWWLHFYRTGYVFSQEERYLPCEGVNFTAGERPLPWRESKLLREECVIPVGGSYF
jgi:hypothetical protein